jgi:formylmethanofuran dehydrogenase subunit E-like metal-binding protein
MDAYLAFGLNRPLNEMIIMKEDWFKVILYLVVAVVLCTQAVTASPDADHMEALGEFAATIAMDELGFEYGSPDVVVLTDAGRAVVDGQTTEKAISGITKISGLQNSDNTLFQINRADWKDLWFYFYDKDTGKGLYLEPKESYFKLSDGAVESLSPENAFSTISPVTGDIYQMLDDTNAGNATQKALGGNAFSLLSLSNGWAYGAPYDLMYAASLHDHFCPGVSSGYIIVKYVEENLPLTDGGSYTVISNPTWCKEDLYPTLWDMTPGKGGVASSVVFTDEDEEYLTNEYEIRPAGIFVLWDRQSNSGKGIALGFQFDETEWTGPSWGEKVYMTAEMVQNLDNPGDYVKVMKEFTVDRDMLSELNDPLNNPYEVIGMMK